MRPVPESIRITRVGLFYVLFTLVVGVAATNTGNNALYLVLAVMLGLLVVSGLWSRQNLRGLDPALEPPGEVFARVPFQMTLRLRNASRRRPRRLLAVWLTERAQARLVPYLPAGGAERGSIELCVERRGRHRIRDVHLSSIFPLGLFQKGMRHRLDLDLLVFPTLLTGLPGVPASGGAVGEQAARHAGWGHELLSLRLARPGDDPRWIHWKQTARTGRTIVTEREAEEGHRLSVLCDNAVGVLASPAAQEGFERLVSEAATVACEGLERGWEVELVTRDMALGFDRGLRHRRRLLEHLALLAPRPPATAPLASRDPRAPVVVLSLPPGAPA